MANPITNKVKTGGIPVIKKDLDSGVIAEANNDGTIFLDKKVKNNSPLAKEAIAHEMVHMDQMARGDLDYNDNNVIWKGKKYSREQMNEGSKNLPWEKEAYNKTENMKKSPAKLNFRLSQGALDTNKDVIVSDLKAKAGKRGAIVGAVDNVLGEVEGFDAFSKSTGSGDKGTNPNPEVDSATEMNKKNKNKSAMKMKATPITKKSQYGGSSSPFHVETKTTEEFKNVTIDGSDDVGTLTVNKTVKPGEKDDYDGSGDYMSDEDWKKFLETDQGKAYTKRTEGETIFDSAFTPNEIKSQEKGEPGTPDKKNMGYYESMDAKWGAGVRNRGDKKVRRISERAARKFDRKGGDIIDPSTGKAYGDTEEGRAKYVKDRAGSATGNYDVGVGKVKLGKAGTPDGPETTSNQQSDGTQTKMVKLPNGNYEKVVVKTENVESSQKMNSNKNKSAFKMKGWKAK